MVTTLKPKNGTSLVEVMVAILIFTIVIVGCSFLLAFGRSQISIQEHYQVATYLAGQKLEELKAGDYYSIQAGQTQEDISLEDLPYSRVTDIEEDGLCKKVSVTVQWEQTGGQRNVNLVTFIGPK
jgi:Tfp pilus assembly protein PilV